MNKSEKDQWKTIYRVGAIAGILTIVVGFTEMGLQVLPDATFEAETPQQWFAYFDHNTFMAMRNLGLINIILTMLGVPFYFALFAAHRKVSLPAVALALCIAYIGAAIFLATNRAFPMLDLSRRYAAAVSGADRAMLEAAARTMLSTGRSHTLGTVTGNFVTSVAGLLFGLIMLRSGVFKRLTAWIGIVGFVALGTFTVSVSFASRIFNTMMLVAVIGGLSSMTWQIICARRLFKLSNEV